MIIQFHSCMNVPELYSLFIKDLYFLKSYTYIISIIIFLDVVFVSDTNIIIIASRGRNIRLKRKTKGDLTF